ncbi:MAG TPA: hypothetical protein DCX53_06440 [Anaerolineae bacterium]|nr:hypothetical protein [Anaerolineae bacterium]
MAETGQVTERRRRDWSIILILLLVGFLCMIVAGDRATRFSPDWMLNANMRSNIDPDSDFLTNRPVNFIEPLDPSILTQPAWINVFLTPGALFRTNTPASTSIPANTAFATGTSISTVITTPTSTSIIPNPTNTSPFNPPRTSTPIPPTSPPATSIPVDLQITKDDFSSTYTAGSTVNYTVIITNNGPNNVTGAVISDNKPAQVTSWDWFCTTVINATGCDAVTGSTSNFTDTVIIQSGGSIEYTVTASISAGASGNLVNTATVGVPAGYTDTNNGNNSATDTDTPVFSADLQITKTDYATHYRANDVITYTIVVSNAGPSNVTGATVTDSTLTNPPNSNIANANWVCSGTGGATCTSGPVSGNINDTVDIPAGASVTYTVTVNVSASPSGPLTNTATVNSPIDPNNGNNSATDTNTLITQIGTTGDTFYYNLPANGTITLNINLIANGDTNPDLVFYEYEVPATGNVYLDLVIIRISSDGTNWFDIFNWGDQLRDMNTNMDFTFLPPPTNVPLPPPEEQDERDIPTSLFYPYPGWGVAIDIDAIVPPGTYSWIQFYAPPDGNDNKTEIDAIEILP